MKKCSNCGTIADSKFCPNCGNPMPNDDLEEKKNDEPLVDFKATVIDEEPIETKQGIISFIKQVAIANATGMSKAAVSETLNGYRTLTAEEMKRICMFLEVPCERFFEDVKAAS